MICFKSNTAKLCHLDMRQLDAVSIVTRSNEHCSFSTFEGIAFLLIKQAKELYKDDNLLEVQFKNNVFATDASTIDLCLSTFHRATFLTQKAARVHK